MRKENPFKIQQRVRHLRAIYNLGGELVEGYYYLKPGDRIQESDEYWNGANWCPRTSPVPIERTNAQTFNPSFPPHRRHVEAELNHLRTVLSG